MNRMDEIYRCQAALDSLPAHLKSTRIRLETRPSAASPQSDDVMQPDYATINLDGMPSCIDDERSSKNHKIDQAKKTTIEDIFADLTLTKEDTAEMESAEFIIDGLVPRGHVTAYPAPPNGGKTALFTHLSGVMADQGYKVYYINVDSPPDSLKRQEEHARQHGYSVLCPDAKRGKSIGDVHAALRQLANSSERLDWVVIIVDTLKKFVAVLSKEAASAFYKLMRNLSAKGATLCLLSHTNKYKDNDGNLIFEGTGDHRSDVDNMIYLLSEKDEASGILEVSSKPDKVRANFEPRSFRIHTKDGLWVEECATTLNLFGPEERIILGSAKILLAHGQLKSGDLVKSLMEHTPYSRDKVRAMLFNLSQGNEAPLRKMRGANNSLSYFLPPD